MGEPSRSLPWYFTKEEIESKSPSRQAGMPKQLEDSLRNSYCSFIRFMGMEMGIRPEISMRATVYCHRFFMRRSHTTNCRYIIACACMRIVLRRDSSGQAQSEGWLNNVKPLAHTILRHLDPEAADCMTKIQRSFTEVEELVIATITETGLIINLCPNGLFYEVATIINQQTTHMGKPWIKILAEVFINDSLRTTLFLQYEPRVIVAGAIMTASKVLKINLLPPDWYIRFGVSSYGPLIDFGMQLGNFYIRSEVGAVLEELQFDSTELLAEIAATATSSRPVQHEQDVSQNVPRGVELDLGENEIAPHQRDATSSDDANAGWIYYTYDPTRPYPRHHRGPHSGPPGRNDDNRFRHPPRPN